MRAAVAQGGPELAIQDQPLPEPGAGEVRVRITACGICGTDLHFMHGGLWAPGLTPGHEMTGVVDALGAGVSGLAEGLPVAVEPLTSCGRCDSCRIGRHATCPELQVYGIHRGGGFAEAICIPAERLFPVPADLAPPVAALTEPMAVNVRGLERGGFEAGQKVLVLGAGSIGLLAVVAARALGAREVWLTARHEHQAALGAKLGARVLRESDPIPEPCELVVETVGGGADTLIQAAQGVAPGGVISVVGVFMGRVEIDALSLFLREASLAFSNCYVHPQEGANFATAVELVSEHREALAEVVSHTFPLDDVAGAFATASDKKSGATKVSILA